MAISVAIDKRRRRWRRRQRRRPSLAIPKLSRRINADYQPSVLSSERAEPRRWRRSASIAGYAEAYLVHEDGAGECVTALRNRAIVREHCASMLDTMLPNVNVELQSVDETRNVERSVDVRGKRKMFHNKFTNSLHSFIERKSYFIRTLRFTSWIFTDQREKFDCVIAFYSTESSCAKILLLVPSPSRALHGLAIIRYRRIFDTLVFDIYFESISHFLQSI